MHTIVSISRRGILGNTPPCIHTNKYLHTVGGFSQGGALSIQSALRYPKRLAAAICREWIRIRECIYTCIYVCICIYVQ